MLRNLGMGYSTILIFIYNDPPSYLWHINGIIQKIYLVRQGLVCHILHVFVFWKMCSRKRNTINNKINTPPTRRQLLWDSFRMISYLTWMWGGLQQQCCLCIHWLHLSRRPIWQQYCGVKIMKNTYWSNVQVTVERCVYFICLQVHYAK